MTLADKIKETLSRPEPESRAVAEVIDFMRFRLGWTCEQSYNAVRKVLPDFTRDRYEDLMMRLDDDAAYL